MGEGFEPLGGLWSPPPSSSDMRAASNQWSEASAKIAAEEIQVYYAGGTVEIKKYEMYYVDKAGRVLVGWHGTYNPPCDMDGLTMIHLEDLNLES